MSGFGKRTEMTAELRPDGETSQAGVEEALALASPRYTLRKDADWSRGFGLLLTSIGLASIVWIISFAVYLYAQVSPDACKHYLKYSVFATPALIFVVVSNLMTNRETLNQILIQICVLAAFFGLSASQANWLLDEGEPRLVSMFVETKAPCEKSADAFCVYGLLQPTDTLPFYTGNNVCRVGKEDYDKALVGQTQMVVRVHPGRFGWEWQEPGCALQF